MPWRPNQPLIKLDSLFLAIKKPREINKNNSRDIQRCVLPFQKNKGSFFQHSWEPTKGKYMSKWRPQLYMFSKQPRLGTGKTGDGPDVSVGPSWHPGHQAYEVITNELWQRNLRKTRALGSWEETLVDLREILESLLPITWSSVYEVSLHNSFSFSRFKLDGKLGTHGECPSQGLFQHTL